MKSNSQETIIIKSENQKVDFIWAIGGGIAALTFIWGLLGVITRLKYLDGLYDILIGRSIFFPFYFVGIPALIISAIVYFALSSNSITVTDKRVIGKSIFGKKVDLPIDKVSAVSSINLIKGVGVATSSGVIRFAFIKNGSEVSEALSALLVARQTQNTPKQSTESLEDLKKLKDLLDAGIITQEEFEEKKKQLLGL